MSEKIRTDPENTSIRKPVRRLAGWRTIPAVLRDGGEPLPVPDEVNDTDTGAEYRRNKLDKHWAEGQCGELRSVSIRVML